MMLHNMAPVWDEALESLLTDEHARKNERLMVADLESLALENAIRIGDIMETLFLMGIYGHWLYTDSAGEILPLDQAAMDKLFANGRVSSEDLVEFTGGWAPRN